MEYVETILNNARYPSVKHVHVLWDGDVSQMMENQMKNITAAQRSKIIHASHVSNTQSILVSFVSAFIPRTVKANAE